jgi:hypothetical protein
MMHNNTMTMLMPDESVIKLVEKEVKSICENGHWLEAVLFTKGNSKDSVTGKVKAKAGSVVNVMRGTGIKIPRAH